MVWQQKQRKNNKITRPYHKVSEAKHHAETRDPPATRRNESGEKKGETDGETKS